MESYAEGLAEKALQAQSRRSNPHARDETKRCVVRRKLTH